GSSIFGPEYGSEQFDPAPLNRALPALWLNPVSIRPSKSRAQSYLFLGHRAVTANTEYFRRERYLRAHRTKRAVTHGATIFRLDYVRVTVCRTDSRPRLQPPRRILF